MLIGTASVAELNECVAKSGSQIPDGFWSDLERADEAGTLADEHGEVAAGDRDAGVVEVLAGHAVLDAALKST